MSVCILCINCGYNACNCCPDCGPPDECECGFICKCGSRDCSGSCDRANEGEAEGNEGEAEGSESEAEGSESEAEGSESEAEGEAEDVQSCQHLATTTLPVPTMPVEVCNLVSTFFDFAPGVPASKAVLLSVLEHLRHEKHMTFNTAGFNAPGSVANLHFLPASLHGPALITANVFAPFTRYFHENQQEIMERDYPGTTDGLLAAIVDLKATLASMALGLCKRCEASEPPRKKLRVANLEICHQCVVAVALGM
jgi:hypothetical protein